MKKDWIHLAEDGISAVTFWTVYIILFAVKQLSEC